MMAHLQQSSDPYLPVHKKLVEPDLHCSRYIINIDSTGRKKKFEHASFDSSSSLKI